ncbi:MAG: ribosome biogenesis GTPase YlqF [Eubacteriales bacterium]
MNIQWYPGHMTKAKRMMQENIKLVDVIIELVDARIPYSSKNPDIDNLANNKPRIIILNKIDLSDTKLIDEWSKWFQDKGYAVSKVNSRTGQGINQLLNQVKEVCKEKIERDRKRGIINRPIRAMVVGIPNVGKSTFINKLVGKASAKTGNRPGVTKGKQWIKLKKDVELLDTPGILWPKFEDQSVGLKLAMIGSIKDDLLNTTEIASNLLGVLQKRYFNLIKDRYEVNKEQDLDQILYHIAEKRNMKKSGNELDIGRTSNVILEEFRNGKLGRITLEKPNDIE